MAERDDHDLRARLEAADPARRPDDARPDWITELTEATMSTDPSTRPSSRGRLAWVLAAAAVVIVAALGFAFVGGGDDTDEVAGDPQTGTSQAPPSASDQASPQPSTQPSEGATEAPDATTTPQTSGEETLFVKVSPEAARCIPPTAESTDRLANIAFEGTVTKLTGKRATIQITQWYRTDPRARYGDEVVLRSSSGNLVRQVGGIAFEKGQSYLLAVNDEQQLVLCGHSGEVDADLTQMYARAFAGD